MKIENRLKQFQTLIGKNIAAEAKQENRPLGLTKDSFPKIIVRHDIRKRWYNEQGVLNIGILDFLLDTAIV